MRSAKLRSRCVSPSPVMIPSRTLTWTKSAPDSCSDSAFWVGSVMDKGRPCKGRRMGSDPLELDSAALLGGCGFQGLHLALELGKLAGGARVVAVGEEQRRPEHDQPGGGDRLILVAMPALGLHGVMRAVGHVDRFCRERVAAHALVDRRGYVGRADALRLRCAGR